MMAVNFQTITECVPYRTDQRESHRASEGDGGGGAGGAGGAGGDDEGDAAADADCAGGDGSPASSASAGAGAGGEGFDGAAAGGASYFLDDNCHTPGGTPAEHSEHSEAAAAADSSDVDHHHCTALRRTCLTRLNRHCGGDHY